ncbi:hypothetical protein SNK05_13700 [Fusarium graminearum]
MKQEKMEAAERTRYKKRVRQRRRHEALNLYKLAQDRQNELADQYTAKAR